MALGPSLLSATTTILQFYFQFSALMIIEWWFKLDGPTYNSFRPDLENRYFQISIFDIFFISDFLQWLFNDKRILKQYCCLLLWSQVLTGLVASTVFDSDFEISIFFFNLSAGSVSLYLIPCNSSSCHLLNTICWFVRMLWISNLFSRQVCLI